MQSSSNLSVCPFDPLPACRSAKKALRSVGPVQWSVAGFDRFLTYSTLGHCRESDGFSHSHAAVRGRKMRALLCLPPSVPLCSLPLFSTPCCWMFCDFLSQNLRWLVRCGFELKQINTKTMQMAKGMSTMLASNWQREREKERDGATERGKERERDRESDWRQSELKLKPQLLALMLMIALWMSVSVCDCHRVSVAAKVQLNIWSSSGNTAQRPVSALHCSAQAGDQWSLPTRPALWIVAKKALICHRWIPLYTACQSNHGRRAQHQIKLLKLHWRKTPQRRSAATAAIFSCDLESVQLSSSDCDCERFLWAYATRSPTLWCNRAN